MAFLSYFNPLEIAKVNSPLSGEIKVVERFGKRTLLVNDAEQSGGTIKGMWGKAIRKIRNYKLQITNCLILGLGGGTVIKILQKQYPKLAIEAIEFDPVMIDIAEKYFGIKPSSKLEIINEDAFLWIKTNKYKKFDLIIFDLYLGKFNPPQSRTLSFLKDIKNLLNPKGFILYNAHYQNDDEDEYKRLLRDCRKIFRRTELLLSYQYSRILQLR